MASSTEKQIRDVKTIRDLIEMAMDVNYIRETRKADTMGPRFGFPKGAKQVRRWSSRYEYWSHNADAYRCVGSSCR